MVPVIIHFFGILLASAACSLAEAAILSLPLVRARILFNQHRRNSKDVLYLKEHITITIGSIVILNNCINIIGSIFIGQQVAHVLGDQWLGAASAVMTFSLIIAGEIIPKTIGERYKIQVSLLISKPLRVCVFILKPVVVLILKITQPFVKEHKLPRVTEEEIKLMLQLGRASGTVEMDEEALCNRVFKLNDLRAYQIMKPIDLIFALPADKTLGEIKELIIKIQFSRIAVYDKAPSDIIGMVQHRVLLREIAKDNYEAKVRDLMTVPIFVNELVTADALIEKFQASRQHFFVVQDEHGKDIGVVTMEDVLEELFGEIYDEKDAIQQ